jgi:hypothetical protein
MLRGPREKGRNDRITPSRYGAVLLRTEPGVGIALLVGQQVLCAGYGFVNRQLCQWTKLSLMNLQQRWHYWSGRAVSEVEWE